MMTCNDHKDTWDVGTVWRISTAVKNLPISEAEIRNRISEGSILAFEIESENDLVLPEWQFDATSEDQLVPGLNWILKRLNQEETGMLRIELAEFLYTQHPGLGGRQLYTMLIDAGEIDEVIESLVDEMRFALGAP